MGWYSHLFKNFPQLVVIHTGKGFRVFTEAEVDYLELIRACYSLLDKVFCLVSFTWHLLTLMYVCNILIKDIAGHTEQLTTSVHSL